MQIGKGKGMANQIHGPSSIHMGSRPYPCILIFQIVPTPFLISDPDFLGLIFNIFIKGGFGLVHRVRRVNGRLQSIRDKDNVK